jgi:nucleoid-associated protein YgaU
MMDQSRLLKFKLGAFLIALISLSACSSSQVDDAAPSTTPETVGDVANAPDAKTDAVPPVGEDPSLAGQTPTAAGQAAPGSLDAKDAAPGGDPSVADANSPPNAGDPAAANTADPAGAADPSMASAPPATDTASNVPTDAQANSNPAPVSQDAPSGDGVHYKVKRGDTLMKIAFENYGDLYRWKEIYEANRAQISDPNHVPPGTRLTLNGAGMVTIERNGDQYLIKHGDTLGVISDSVYGTTQKWKKLWENNRQLIKNPNKIYAGFYLYYQPEARLTHDSDKPGGDAANTPQNLPFKNQGAAPVKTAVNTVVPPAGPTVRAPASK